MAEAEPTYACGMCKKEIGRGGAAFFKYAAHMMDPKGHHMLVCPLRHPDYPDFACGEAFGDQKELISHFQTHF
jgi:hypothetical protein